MNFNVPYSANTNIATESLKYAKENVKEAYYDASSRRFIIRYTLNGQWTWMSLVNIEDVTNMYHQLLDQKRAEYIEIHTR